jgi:hypothetical protein
MGWWGAIFVGVVLTLLIERVLVDRWLSPRFSKFWSRRRDRRYERDNEFMRDVVRAYVDPAVAVAIVGQSLGRVIWGLGFGAHPNRGCRSWGLKPPDSRRHLAM